MNVLHFTRSPSDRLIGFCDSNFAGNLNDRKSVISICIFLGNNLIMCSSKKQVTMSRLSAEFEYRSIGYATTNLRMVFIFML